MLEMLFTRVPRSKILLNICTTVLTAIYTLLPAFLPAVLCLGSHRTPRVPTDKYRIRTTENYWYDLISHPILCTTGFNPAQIKVP